MRKNNLSPGPFLALANFKKPIVEICEPSFKPSDPHPVRPIVSSAKALIRGRSPQCPVIQVRKTTREPTDA